MAADGHLLLILHKPPADDHAERAGRFFWRDAQGSWKSSDLGTGSQALKTHLDDFARRIDELEDTFDSATSSRDYFQLLQELVPLDRSLRNAHAALQQAREMMPNERALISARDQAGDLARAAELLQSDAKHGLDFTIARQSEEQARRTYEMAISAHRLNLLAAIFFPLATLSSLFGMNLIHGYESTPHLFWLLAAAGLVVGTVLALGINRRPPPPPRPRPGSRDAPPRNPHEKLLKK
jgi:Mg2+ and Co2+ transporter CorA